MKYLFVIARYNDHRQNFFNTYTSKRNKEYCYKHNIEYIEIDNSVPLELFRNNPTWWKFTLVRDYINSGHFKDGDIITHLDADMCYAKIDCEYPNDKTFSYSIDSGNTHCMGSYSIKINDWSVDLINNILSNERYEFFSRYLGETPGAFGNYGGFWNEFREQASWYSLAGIKRHSWDSFWNLENYGWHSEYNDNVIYSLEQLDKNVQILPTAWNVTEFVGESSCQFDINKTTKQDVIIRHFAGGQQWRHEWFL